MPERVATVTEMARQHGSHVRYVQGPDENDQPGKGCHCVDCRAANSRYEQERNRRIAPPYVSAGPARAHVAWLRTQGIGLKSLSKVAAIPYGTLSKLMYGDPARQMAPSKRVRPTTHERILAVTPSMFTNDTCEPSGPILAMVDRLVAAGVPKVRIAERLGQTKALQLAARGGGVTRRHASMIRAMVAELDAGTLVTIKRDRHGGERVIAPLAAPMPVWTRQELDEYDNLVLALAEIVETRNDETEWRKQAACRGRPNWLWFPARGDAETLAQAKKVCRACIVRGRCLDANVAQRDGVWGGLSGEERRRLRQPIEAAS